MAEVLNQIQISARFKKDYRRARRHPEYTDDDLEQLLEDLARGDRLPTHYNEHPLGKRGVNWAGFLECHLGGDLVVIFRRFPGLVRMHRIGGNAALFGSE